MGIFFKAREILVIDRYIKDRLILFDLFEVNSNKIFPSISKK